uniref:CB1 cannabinoid receptor-interacting protein 1b isoform X1 n=1 Tax=Monopterus albus TaxID=43700 RepID=UPI0009B46E66|nr:CB1 cannabinoid receptor-interacting protein 1 isoform X1 [Monopterus albus]
MADVPQIVKIGISLKMLPNNTAVYFKSDGARFGQTRTIKLLTGSKYKIEVVVKPGAVVATSMSVGGVTFPLEQQSKDPQSVVYTGQYDTEGLAHTKSGERQPVQISIQVCTQGRELTSIRRERKEKTNGQQSVYSQQGFRKIVEQAKLWHNIHLLSKYGNINKPKNI